MSSAQLLQLSRELRQSFPVEGDAVAWSRWRQSHALVECEPVLDISVKPKAVGFEVGAIRAGRQQMNGYVMRPVSGIERVDQPQHGGNIRLRIWGSGVRISSGAPALSHY
jgi:hypothetical protein